MVKSLSGSLVSKVKRKGRNDLGQSRLFMKKAREIGADEERSAADELLGHLAQQPPAPKVEHQRERGTKK